ncbi:MAG: exosortase/archaeosortase family protein [Planctomycetaceae bacterium]|jgi:exosortase|nr:exosortase/archaeosortase family protein [Planctomycetaceae bacterium]
MTDNENNRSFEIPPTSDQTEESHHHFDAEVPNAPKKKTRHGSFSTGFTPRRETPSVSSKKASDSTTDSASESGSAADKLSQEMSAPTMSTPSKTASTTTTTTTPSVTEFKTPVWSQPTAIDKAFERTRFLILCLVMLPLSLFAFWPSLCDIVYAWYTQLDYGHGFFVLPLVVLFLYLRLDTYPGTHYRLTWIGLFPILICCIMRFYAANQYMDALDQWSLLFWILGVVWFFYGNRVFFWALPSLLFLIFMFQLPWRFEVLMRHNLQQFAAQFAAVLLQILGEPAIPIKNTIRLSTMDLAVEQACSGIRFLISIFAISFATILLIKRPWWQNIFILIISIPIALFVNAARIAMTGILLLDFNEFITGITPENRNPAVVADEIAGIFMIFVAFGIFVAFVYYLGRVFRKVEI